MLASLSRPRKPCSPCFRGRTQLQRGPERNRLQAYHRTFSIAGVLNSEVKVELLADHCLAGGSTPESPYLGCPLTYATPLLAYLKFLAILDSRQTRICKQTPNFANTDPRVQLCFVGLFCCSSVEHGIVSAGLWHTELSLTGMHQTRKHCLVGHFCN